MIDDTVLLGAAAIARGFRAVMTPNSVLSVETSSARRGIAFARGVAPSTDQGTAAILEEQDVGRTLIASGGISVPKFYSHTFVDNESLVLESLRRLGGRALARPAWQGGRVLVVQKASELEEKLGQLDEAAGASSRRSGRPQSRFMLEEVSEPADRPILISHGDVVGAPVGLAADVADIARKAVLALPGIEVASVSLALRPTDGRWLVTGVRQQPRIWTYRSAARDIADRILSAELRVANLPVSESSTTPFHYSVEIGGVPDPVALVTEIEHGGLASRCAGSNYSKVESGGTVLFEMEGTPLSVSESARRLIQGSFSDVLPLWVAIERVDS